MKHKLTKNLKDSLKKNIESNLFQALWYLYVYLNINDDDLYEEYSKDVAQMMYDIEYSDTPSKSITIKQYIAQ